MLRNNAYALESKTLAPKFDGAAGWLNVSRPIALEELRGKIVLLDFWTYACINCMHVIPDLKKLEAKFGDDLVVIGVHSAKFSNEKESENISQAIIRYDIRHPVINDANFSIWRAYSARGWPTFVLIDQNGYLVDKVSGEGNYDYLSDKISALITGSTGKTEASPLALPIALERNKVPATFLSFPGKLLVDAQGERIFIADSGHNRVVVAGLDGSVSDIIGSGAIGHEDGSFSATSFHNPQGLALKDNILYIADTDNHLIRAADLTKKSVVTLVGTGNQGSDLSGGQVGTSQAINSPWDLVILGNTLYVAMAGSHQLWQIDLASKVASVFAGIGREEISDGPLLKAALAQPSGLTTDGKQLYFADSEVSAIRVASLGKDGTVKTLIGRGLFRFGDKDGTFNEALLQHPLGVAFGGSKIFVADSFNHKIKEIDPSTNSIKTIKTSGTTFREPGGLFYTSGKLYIADTNSNAIKTVDIQAGVGREIRIADNRSVQTSPVQRAPNSPSSFLPNVSEVFLPEVEAGRDGELRFNLILDLAEGMHLNQKAPSKAVAGIITDTKGQEQITTIKENSTIIPIKLPDSGDVVKVQVDTTLYYCRTDGKGLCYIKSFSFTQPVKLVDGSKESSIDLRAKLE